MSKFKAKQKKCPWILCFICLWRSEDVFGSSFGKLHLASMEGKVTVVVLTFVTLVSWKGPNAFVSSELSPSGNVVFWEMSRNRENS